MLLNYVEYTARSRRLVYWEHMNMKETNCFVRMPNVRSETNRTFRNIFRSEACTEGAIRSILKDHSSRHVHFVKKKKLFIASTCHEQQHNLDELERLTTH